MNSSTVLVSWYGKNVNCKNMNSSTVLVSWYEYERVEDRLPMCRGVRENSCHFRQRDQLAHNNTQQQVQRKNVNRKNVNSSTVLVSGYEYERVEDRLPMCRGVCRGV